MMEWFVGKEETLLFKVLSAGLIIQSPRDRLTKDTDI